MSSTDGTFTSTSENDISSLNTENPKRKVWNLEIKTKTIEKTFSKASEAKENHLFFVDKTWGLEDFKFLHDYTLGFIHQMFQHCKATRISRVLLFFDGKAKKFIRFVGIDFQIQDLDNHGRALQKIAKLLLLCNFVILVKDGVG